MNLGDSMNTFMAFLLICIAICLLLIWYINIYNRYQEYIIRINEAEANIDSVLRKRFDLLNKSIGIIKTITNTKSDILNMIVDLKAQKLTNFELDRILYEALNEFHMYAEKYEELKKNEEFVKIELGLNESEASIIALRKYYNDIITDYNKLIRIFPSNLVGKISKYKLKTYFDGKNMEDNITNDFKL